MGKGKNGRSEKGFSIKGKPKAERYKTRQTYHRPTSPIRDRLEELRIADLEAEGHFDAEEALDPGTQEEGLDLFDGD